MRAVRSAARLVVIGLMAVTALCCLAVIVVNTWSVNRQMAELQPTFQAVAQEFVRMETELGVALPLGYHARARVKEVGSERKVTLWLSKERSGTGAALWLGVPHIQKHFATDLPRVEPTASTSRLCDWLSLPDAAAAASLVDCAPTLARVMALRDGQADDLAAWVAGYRAGAVDAWGSKLKIEMVGNGWKVSSAGPDGVFGTDDDVLPSALRTPSGWR